MLQSEIEKRLEEVEERLGTLETVHITDVERQLKDLQDRIESMRLLALAVSDQPTPAPEPVPPSPCPACGHEGDPYGPEDTATPTLSCENRGCRILRFNRF